MSRLIAPSYGFTPYAESSVAEWRVFDGLKKIELAFSNPLGILGMTAAIFTHLDR